MSYYVGVHEVARLAVDIEDAGNRFYTHLVQVSHDEKAKKLFLYLAEQETQHKIKFQTIADQAAKTETQAEYVVDIYGLMKAAIDDLQLYVFNEKATGNAYAHLSGAVAIGIHGEEESIRIYGMLKQSLVNKFAPVLEKIIAEEQEHLQFLFDYREIMKL
jgi:rubrerythrin